VQKEHILVIRIFKHQKRSQVFNILKLLPRKKGYRCHCLYVWSIKL